MWKVQLFNLNYDYREQDAAIKVINSGWLSMGENVIKFENEFSNFIGHGSMCSAVANCTAALHMALLALNIKEDDEVIIPALTFVADANVVSFVGAKVVLADCDSYENWNVSLNSIKNSITEKTKAVIVVHFAGYPIEEIIAIRNFCKDNKIILIEDVAHAPGASVNNQKCGSFGDISCFSFFSNKNLSIGEGGLVSTRNEGLYKKLNYLRSHGMTSLTLDRHKGRSISYDVDQPGLNYRIDEIRAAIGLVQLKKLIEGNKKRELLTKRYRSSLENSNILIPFSNQSQQCVSAFHILPVLIPEKFNRNIIISKLKKDGIQTSIHYPAFWNFKAYKKKFNSLEFPIAAHICNHELTLPLFPTMSYDEVDYVCDSLLKACKSY